MILTATKYVHLPLVFAKNELVEVVESVELENTDRAGLRYFLEIWVQKAANSAEYVLFRTLKGSEKPPVESGGATYFEGFQPYIDEYLNGLLAYTAPDLTKIIRANKTTTSFYLKSYAERDGVLVVGSELTGSVQWAIKAALGENDFPRYKHSFFSIHMDANMPFLTHQPNGMVVSPTQLVNLSWICNLSPVPEFVTLNIRRRCANGYTDLIVRDTVEYPTQHAVYHIPVGFEQLALDGVVPSPVVGYEVWLQDDESRRITEVRKFILDYAYYEYEQTLFFSNNLGGFDSLRFTGGSSKELTLNTTVGERATGANDTATDGNAFVVGKEGERLLKLNSGTVAESEWLNYLEELAWAEQVYMAPAASMGNLSLSGLIASGKLGELVPLVLKSNKYVPRVDGEDIGSREFEFVAAKWAVATNILPNAAGTKARPKVWIPKANYCLVDAFGKQTGYAGAAKLELHYSDVNPPEPVPGVALKDNDEGTEGYVAPIESPACVVGYAAFTNVAINRLGTFKKNTCSAGFTGVEAMISVAGGLFGGATLKAANDLAEAEWSRRNTQAAANANVDGCVLAIENYTYSVPSGKAHFRWNAMRVGSVTADNYVAKTNAGVTKGNGWPTWVPDTADVFVPGTNDIDLPVAFGTNPWQFGVYGKGGLTVVTIYVNGVQVATATSSAYFFNVDVAHASIGDGARVYVKVE